MGEFRHAQGMRLFLSSDNPPQIERLAKIFLVAGIQCEVRAAQIGAAKDSNVIEAELWVCDDQHYKTASILFAGFTRRQQQAQMWRRD